MDSTGGDLSHAAQEVDLNIEKQSVRSSSNSRLSAHGEVVGEKQVPDQHSSGSSSEDVTRLDKLDSRIVKVGEVKDGDEAFAHLPSHERDILRRQLDIPPVTVTYRTLYRYATKNDLLVVVISAICAIIGGAVMPLMTVSILFRIVAWTIVADSIPGYLWPTGWNFPKLLQWKQFACTAYIHNISSYFVLHILGDWRIRYDLCLYSWLYLYRRAYYAENSRAISSGHHASEHCLF